MPAHTGCWSCRARHRKCDERKPACKNCTQNSVHCHGYGPKPEWMDRGPKQHDEVMRLNESARRARQGVQAQAKDRVVKSLQKTSAYMQASSQNFSKSHVDRLGQSTEPTNSLPLSYAVRENVTSLPSGSTRTIINWSVHSYEGAELMLYYLDVVMPLQFPHCSNTYRHKARRWIFWLLTKNELFKTAALSLSALHRYVSSSDPVNNNLNTLARRYGGALQKLQEWLLIESAANDDRTDESLVELLAVSVFLVNFEVLRSAGYETAHVRLDTVITTVQMMGPTMSAFSIKDGNWITDAAIFLISTVVWFDTLSSMSLGTDPKTQYKALLHIPSIDMAELMGCQNWALEVIGDLARINGLIETNSTDLSADARKELESAHQQLHKGLKQVQSQDEITPRISAVTQLFAYSALVELHILTSGPLSRLPQIQSATRKVLGVLQTFPAQESVSGLAWPICVAGSMAHPLSQHVFEQFISRGLQGSQRDFGNYATALTILKTCWAERQQDPVKPWGWRETMSSMGCSALLI